MSSANKTQSLCRVDTPTGDGHNTHSKYECEVQNTWDKSVSMKLGKLMSKGTVSAQTIK